PGPRRPHALHAGGQRRDDLRRLQLEEEAMKKVVMSLAALMLLARAVLAQEAFVGEIRMVAFNFAPTGWALCDGQLLSIAQNTALFSLLGTTYGGDGQTTFALPDLRERVPIHAGSGPRELGSTGGVASTDTV